MAMTLDKPVQSKTRDLEPYVNGHRQNIDNVFPVTVAAEPYTLALTRDMVATLADAGHLDDLNYQHINGRIVVYPMQSNFHKVVVIAVLFWLCGAFGRRFVQTDGGVELPPPLRESGNPQPDVTVSAAPTASYPGNTIPVSDILFAVEVSLTTLDFDTEEKAQLYARAGIADYWVVDIENRQVIVFREPTDEGYSSTTPYAETETVAPLAKPEAGVLVRELLPPPSDLSLSDDMPNEE